jgi:hypothetical protein
MPATLMSNRGDEKLSIELGKPSEFTACPGFESTIRLAGRHWGCDDTRLATIVLDGIWLSCAELKALHDHIANWIDQPLDCMAAENLTGDFELTRLPGESVLVSFGPRSDTISFRNPVVSIVMSASTLRGEFHFVTDQSCLRIFAQELSGLLA